MKRRIVITACAMALFVSTGAFAAGKTLNVQNKTSEIKSMPSTFASTVATAKYGDSLTVLEEKGMWSKISTADQKTTGWILSSALTKQKLTLAAAGKDAQTGASSGEMALAGKGFTPQVEAQFKAKHSDIDFTWIDKMEKSKVSSAESLKFLKEGGISLSEGGVK